MRAQVYTTDTQVATGKIFIKGLALFPNGSDACNVEIYDEADADKTATKKIASLRALATVSESIIFDDPLVLSEGCYLDINGTGAVAYLYT